MCSLVFRCVRCMFLSAFEGSLRRALNRKCLLKRALVSSFLRAAPSDSEGRRSRSNKRGGGAGAGGGAQGPRRPPRGPLVPPVWQTEPTNL